MEPEVHEDAMKAAVSPIALSTISTMANFTKTNAAVVPLPF